MFKLLPKLFGKFGGTSALVPWLALIAFSVYHTWEVGGLHKDLAISRHDAESKASTISRLESTVTLLTIRVRTNETINSVADGDVIDFMRKQGYLRE